MKTLLLIVYLTCGLHLTAFSHPGGHGEGPQLVAECNSSKGCTFEEANSGAIRVIKFLNDTYRLPTEWKEVKNPQWTKQMEYEMESVWVSHFFNPEIADSNNQNLYIVISNQGFLIGVGKEISKFKEITNYNWTIGIGIILILATLSMTLIHFMERKSKAS